MKIPVWIGILLACFLLAGCLLPRNLPMDWSLFTTGTGNWAAISGSLSNSCTTPYPNGGCTFLNASNATMIFPESSRVVDWLNITVSGSIGSVYRSTGCYYANFSISNGSATITGLTSFCTPSEAHGGSSSNTTKFNFTRSTYGAPNIITNGSSSLSFAASNATVYMEVYGTSTSSEYWYQNSVSAAVSYTYLNGTSEPLIPVIVSATALPSPAYSSSTLLGYCNATEEYLYNVSYNFSWFKNGVLNSTGSVGPFIQGVTVNVGNVSNSSLAFGDAWVLQCIAYNTNGTSAPLNSTPVYVFGVINATYGTGITGVAFRPIHAFAQNVQAVNQTSLVSLYSLNNTKNYTVQVVGKINVSISGFSMKCANSYSSSAATAITTSWTNLSTLEPYDPTPSTCYQETATERGTCGAVPGGSYMPPYAIGTEWYDGNWNTNSTLSNSMVYANYSVSTFASNATLQIKLGNTTTTNTSNLSIWACANNSSVTRLRIQYYNQSYGNGSDGTLIFTTTTKSYGNLVAGVDYNNTSTVLYLNLNRQYQFVNFTLGNGTVLSTQNKSGSALYLLVQNTANISGIINLSNVVNESSSFVAGTETYVSPSLGTPGAGGSGGSASESGGGLGAAGGSGGSPIGTGGAGGILSSPAGTVGAAGTAGGTSAGGGGAAYETSGYCTGYVRGGNGSGIYGGSGTNGAVSCSNGITRTSAAGGGGGGGEEAKVYGVHFVLKAKTLYSNTVIDTSGAKGSTGGSGGNGSRGGDPDEGMCASGGQGGSGGGGSSAGNISIYYGNLGNARNITALSVGGPGGNGGIGGTSTGLDPACNARALQNGSTGTVGINGTASYEVLGTFVDCYYNSTWNNLLTLPQEQLMSSLYEEGIYWTLAAQDGIGELWCWADFNNPYPLKQSFNVSIDGIRYE